MPLPLCETGLQGFVPVASSESQSNPMSMEQLRMVRLTKEEQAVWGALEGGSPERRAVLLAEATPLEQFAGAQRAHPLVPLGGLREDSGRTPGGSLCPPRAGKRPTGRPGHAGGL